MATEREPSGKRDGEARRGDEGVDEPTEYDEVRHKQPNTVRSEPGASPYDEAREGTPQERVIVKGERERPGPTEPPAEPGRRPNQFTTEGARIHGTPDDRDKPAEYRDRAWQPDEYKPIRTDVPDDEEFETEE